MPAIYKQCSIDNAFNFRRDVHERLGHVTSLKIGETEFEADFTLKEPMEEGDVGVVGVLSSFDWEGGYAQPQTFAFQVSITNKNEMMTLIHTEMKSLNVEICYNIYEYDKQEGAFFNSLHTNDAAILSLIHVVGEERQIFLEDEPSMEVPMPENYQVVLGVVPQDEQQDIQMAVDTNQKFVKPWGITRG